MNYSDKMLKSGEVKTKSRAQSDIRQNGGYLLTEAAEKELVNGMMRDKALPENRKINPKIEK